MGLFINTNLASLNAQRNLQHSTTKLAKSFQRLSSGLRINSAADDSAGLAISTRMTAQVRGLNQAVRNTNDAISLSQTAEGALQETTSILQRIRELSVQAANDTNTTADRGSIQAEINQLVSEIDRIAETTTFNNQNVLDGSFSGAKFHVGANSRETIQLKTTDARSNIIGRQARYVTAQVNTEGFAVDDVVISGVTIRATELTDDQVSTTLNAGSAIAKAAAINDSYEFTGVKAILGETVATADGNAGGANGPGVQAVTLDSNNYIVINGELITGFMVQDTDADDSLVNAINSVTNVTGVQARLNDAGQLELVADDARNIEIDVQGQATRLGFANDVVVAGNFTLQSEPQINMILANNAVARIGIGQAGQNLLGVNSDFAVNTIDVTTREGANVAIEVLDVALSQVSTIRSDLGAVQNRLESTISNLSTTSENISAARSRIVDADFAEETAFLARNQIIQQAGISILSQANQQPQVVLSLLG